MSSGQTVLEAHDRNTHRTMPHQRRNIHGTATLADTLIKLPQALPVPGQAWIQKSRVLFQQLERLRTHWGWRKTAIPHHLGGDALAHLAVCSWRAQQSKVRMRVHVDKSRRYNPPAGIDLTLRTAFQVRRHGGDASPADAHVHHRTGRACAVDYCAVFDQ